MKKVFLTLLLISLSLITSGCEFSDVLDYIDKAFESEYLLDTDLESATWKNSSEPGAISGKLALDATKEKYANSFSKKVYFDEIGKSEDKGYIYFNKQRGEYLALSALVNIEGEEYYEIIMFTYDNPDDIYDYSKSIIETYYVNLNTLEIFTAENKPLEKYALRDDTYGFELSLPKEFDENYITLYEEPFEIDVAGKKTNVRLVTVSYREGNISNDLFDIAIFEGSFKASDFNTSGDAFFLGANNKYSVCLLKAGIEDGILQNPRRILDEDFETIVSSSKIFDVQEDKTKQNIKEDK